MTSQDRPHRPRQRLELCALTDALDDAPTSAVQYALLAPDGTREIYGDQDWVASGQAIRDGSWPHGVVVCRTITITYGEWRWVDTDD